jgi:hypothetical protein
MTPAKKSKRGPNLKDPILRGVWRKFGLHPPPISSPGVASSCSTFSDASNELDHAKRGWQESAENVNVRKINDCNRNGLATSCHKNYDSLEKSCIKLDILDAQSNAQTATAATPSQSFFQPVYLPIDKSYESKYVMHKYRLGRRRGKTFQEQTYLFLEHPSGWFGFIYHMSV